ncbi:hypothetical protein V1508DRAFT_457775 [Lipomyces doorenjongii]|uniref:uncharacterized protein n=1 Tax=Lipomyces doorenjongii TaxID=383834 RepID=UPI0034CE66C2
MNLILKFASNPSNLLIRGQESGAKLAHVSIEIKPSRTTWIWIFEELKKQYDEEVAKNPQVEITITLKDGSTKIATAWETTPMTIAPESWTDRISERVFWHSSAHLRHYGCHLCMGSHTEDGFFYEMSIDNGRAVSQADFSALETICQERHQWRSIMDPFARSAESAQYLLKIFSHNIYEQTTIGSKIPDGTSMTVYRCGPLIDLCVGSHVPNSGHVKAFKVLKKSASYFLGDAGNDRREFMFSALMRSECRKRGYEEVITPNIFNSKPDHWHYKDDMFAIGVEKKTFALKRMNCPSHCLIFKSRERSYRELPWTMADFGVLHRNEYSGALTGLTLVRGFQQYDIHIFCTRDQIEDEITGVLDFLKHIYDKFGVPWELNPGDGAFYSPKVDRFNLEYHIATSTNLLLTMMVKKSQYAQPVMIHRVIMGSVEYFVGKWPFWLSPRQVLVITVGVKYNDFADEVRKALFDASMYAETVS